VFGLERPPVDLHSTRTCQTGGALDDGGAGLLVSADLLGVVEVADHVVAVVTERRPFEVGRGQARHPAGLRPGFGRAQQGLGRDARPIGAFAADQLALDYRHPLARLEQAPGSTLAAGTKADENHIESVHRITSCDLFWRSD